MGLGYVEGITHDYVRHGTTTLFAALDIAIGAVFTECKPRHRHQESLSFLRRLDACIPEPLDVHLIVDHYSTHKHRKVPTWLAQRPRYSHSLHANLLVVAESGGALVWPDHPTGHSPRVLQQRQGFDRKDRLVCPALQPPPSTLRLDRYGGFHPGKDHAPLFIYFWDATGILSMAIRPRNTKGPNRGAHKDFISKQLRLTAHTVTKVEENDRCTLVHRSARKAALAMRSLPTAMLGGSRHSQRFEAVP